VARILRITALILAGEMVFALPFHTQRFFRATLMDAFGITNTQLGDMFAAYGVVAMLSYFFGGPFADRYSARSLMAVSLVGTAVGGFYMATFPGVGQMSALYGFWGMSSTFLFWAALIKATRDWGGDATQGVAFGILDGGRGFVAAAFGAISVSILALYLPLEADLVTSEDRRAGLRTIILFYSAITLACAALVWFLVPHDESTVNAKRNPFKGVTDVLKHPLIWAQAGVIIFAYCGYKGLDTYQLYAVEVLGMNEVDAARLTTWGAYTRPIAAVAAGLIADRFDSARSIVVAFVLMVISYGMLSTTSLENGSMNLLMVNLLVTFVAVYAIRGIYYALLEETRIPKHLTGASVAIIAFIGYTPEVFFGPVTGRILDANPGVAGHLDYFTFLATMAVSGVVITLILIWLNRHQPAAAVTQAG
jgi:nitrate/nitrite transporter NarK